MEEAFTETSLHAAKLFFGKTVAIYARERKCKFVHGWAINVNNKGMIFLVHC